MNYQTANIFRDVEGYISKQAFKNVKNYMTNLQIMKYNINLEWFNIACIAMHIRPNDLKIVNTKEGWREYLSNDDLEIDDSKENKGCLLRPFVDMDKEIITFTPYEFIYSRAIDITIKKLHIKLHTRMEDILKSHNFESLKTNLKKNWQQNCIRQYLNTFSFYRLMKEDEKLFFQRTLLVIYGPELQYTPDKKVDWDLSYLGNKEKNNLLLYQQIHEVVTNFHRHVDYFFDEYSQRDAQIKELAYEEKAETTTGYEIFQKLNNHEKINWKKYGLDIEI